jgi:hypothetical protein
MAQPSDNFQRQSLLFRLPRELRDQIYQAYVFEEHGYLYDFATKKMRVRNSSTTNSRAHYGICQNLRITCKLAAKETRGLALQMNLLTFETGFSEDTEKVDDRSSLSPAGRFRCALDYYHLTKILILSYATDLNLLSPEILQQVSKRFPDLGQRFEQIYTTIRRWPGNDERLISSWDELLLWVGDFTSWPCQPVLEAFSEVASLALELVKTSNTTGYHAAITKAFADGRPTIFECLEGSPWRHYFTPGSESAITSMQLLDFWSMPTPTRLTEVESCLTRPRTKYEINVIQSESERHIPSLRWDFEDVDFRHSSENTRWYFSAAAVALQFLQRLPQGYLQYVRNITLRENRKAVAQPERHLEGFAPYCLLNRNLRIVRYISFSENLLPLDWAAIDQTERQSSLNYNIDGHTIICAFVQWVQNLTLLAGDDTPASSFRVVLSESQDHDLGYKAWNCIRETAAFHASFKQVTLQKSHAVVQTSLTKTLVLQATRIQHRSP